MCTISHFLLSVMCLSRALCHRPIVIHVRFAVPRLLCMPTSAKCTLFVAAGCVSIPSYNACCLCHPLSSSTRAACVQLGAASAVCTACDLCMYLVVAYACLLVCPGRGFGLCMQMVRMSVAFVSACRVGYYHVCFVLFKWHSHVCHRVIGHSMQWHACAL